jgi:hypothetical protein
VAGASDGDVPKIPSATSTSSEGGDAKAPGASPPRPTPAPLAVPGELTSTPSVGVPSIAKLSSDSDEDLAEETRVQLQPPNFAEIAASFVPVSDAAETGKDLVGIGGAVTPLGGMPVAASIMKEAGAGEPYGDESVTEEGRPVPRPRPIPRSDDTESVTQRERAHALPRLQSAADDDDSAAMETVVRPGPMGAPEPPRPMPAPTPRISRGGVHGGAFGAVARAPVFEGVSDSGLRLTQDQQVSGEQLSMGVPISSGSVRRQDAVAPDPMASYEQPRVPFEPPPGAYYGNAPGPRQVSTGAMQPYADAPPPPRYDILVAVVAFLSFAIPFGLFLYLYDLYDRSNAEPPRTPSVVESDPTKRDDSKREKASAPPAESPSRRH